MTCSHIQNSPVRIHAVQNNEDNYLDFKSQTKQMLVESSSQNWLALQFVKCKIINRHNDWPETGILTKCIILVCCLCACDVACILWWCLLSYAGIFDHIIKPFLCVFSCLPTNLLQTQTKDRDMKKEFSLKSILKHAFDCPN